MSSGVSNFDLQFANSCPQQLIVDRVVVQLELHHYLNPSSF